MNMSKIEDETKSEELSSSKFLNESLNEKKSTFKKRTGITQDEN